MCEPMRRWARCVNDTGYFVGTNQDAHAATAVKSVIAHSPAPRNAHVDAEEDDDALHARNDVKAVIHLI